MDHGADTRTEKPKGCETCPLFRLGLGFVQVVPPKDVSKIRLLVQGETPSKDDVDASTPFSDKTGHWLKNNILGNAGVGANEVLFDNTLRCLPPENAKGENYPLAGEKQIAESNCRVYDIWNRLPSHIPLLLVGSKALLQRLGVGGISDYHGHIQRDGDGRIVGATFHPSAVAKNPNLLPVAIRETANLLEAAANPKVLDRPKVFKQFVPYYPGQQFVADLEWNPATQHLTVLGIAYNGDKAYSTYTVDEGLSVVRAHLREGTRIIGHNIIDADLPRIGVMPQSWNPKHVADTMVMAHLVHAHLAELGLLGLGDMVKFYFPTTDWKQDKADLLTYNGYDNAYNYRLFEALSKDLDATEQWHLVEKQQKLMRISSLAREKGVQLDYVGLRDYALNRDKERKVFASTFPFNPNSPPQMKKWLKEEKGISVSDTGFDTLVKLKGIDPEVDRLIEYRDDTKSLSTWFPIQTTDKCEKCGVMWTPRHYCGMVESPKTGKLVRDKGKRVTLVSGVGNCAFPAFKPTGTAVSRFSCADPNFQNLPPHLRRFLIARDPSLMLVAFDGAQIENRTSAWIAGARGMLAAFNAGVDFHRANAANIFGKKAEEITKQERQFGKTVTHATNYKETHYNLARRLFGNTKKESLEKAKTMQDGFFNAYPEMRQWHKDLEQRFVRGDVMLRNPFGRVRYVYERTPHEFAKRAAHFLGCSTAAEIINGGGVKVWDEFGLEFLLIVHDELVYEVEQGDKGARLAADIKAILEAPIEEMAGFVVPVSMKVGWNYGPYSEANPLGMREVELKEAQEILRGGLKAA